MKNIFILSALILVSGVARGDLFGGSSATPQVVPASLPDAPLAATSSVATQTSSTTFISPFTVSGPVTATGCFFIANGVTNKVDCGIYNSNGTLLASAGSTAMLSANTLQTLNFTTAVSLSPGIYYTAIGINNASGQLKGTILAGRCYTVANDIPLVTGVSIPGTVFQPAGPCATVGIAVSGGSF